MGGKHPFHDFRRNLRLLAGLFVLYSLQLPAALVSTFQTGLGGWHLGTIAVGNLDSTPDQEIVISYRDLSANWWLDAFKYNGQRLVGFPYSSGSEEMNVSPTLYDLNHDGKNEIIFTRGNHVIAMRGDGSIMWSNTVNSANYVPNGGYQTVTNGFYWSADGSFSNRLPATAVFSSQVSPPIVMDLNGAGTNEIVTAWKIDPDSTSNAQDFNPFINDIFGSAEWGTQGEVWSGGVIVFDANTGQQNFAYHIHQLLESGLAVGQTDAGAQEIFALNDSDSVVAFDKSKPFGLFGKGMLHGQFGKNQRVMTGSYQVPIDIYAADIDGDGRDECLVAGTQLSNLWQPNETILDDDGKIMWRRWLPTITYLNLSGWLNSSCLIPVNPDHDNHADVIGFNDSYEITFRYWDGSELVDHPGWPKNFYPLLPTPPVVGDVDGDGKEEIIVGTYDPTISPSVGNLLIYALDGTLKQSIPVLGGIKHIPALADAEGIGRLDVIYRSLLGTVYVQNFGATTTNLVSWATHRGNMHRDGNHGISLFPAGTPLVTQKTPGYRSASFTWSNSTPAQLYRIYRAPQGSGPFTKIATVTGNTKNYTDYGLAPGWLYFYEVRAVYANGTVASSPFTVLSSVNNNLIANGGFEEDDNSHWDKWYTGNVDMTNMVATPGIAHQGRQSMQIILNNQTGGGSIAQFDQYGIPDSTLYVTPGNYYSYGGYFKTVGLTQPSENWFAWGSAKTGYDTNNRPNPPWPYYFTPHVVAGPGTKEWTYVNRTFQLPAGFPNLELGHQFSLVAAGSGSIFIDDVSFRPLPSPTATNWSNLVPFASTWKYFTNTPATNWFSPSFNDSTWRTGTAKFGAGGGPTNIVTQLPQLKPAYYFRKKFSVPSGQVEELLLSATCTDDSGGVLYPIRVFLNGSEIPASIEAVTSQGNEVHYFDLTPFTDYIFPGSNTIAVLVSNAWADWDDVAFDVRLQAVITHPPIPMMTVTKMGLTANGPTGSIWQIQSTDSLTPPNWQPMVTFTNQTGSVQSFQDTGQNGRLAPGGLPQRYYRLMAF